MNNEQAINVLLQVAELAQSRGILKLNEANIVFQAVSVLAPKEEQPQPQPEQPADEVPVKSLKPKK